MVSPSTTRATRPATPSSRSGAARAAPPTLRRRMDAKFTGPSYTLGIEEELMILDGETFELANEIEAVVAAHAGTGEGEVKPELLQSVLEIATPPSKDLAEAGG